MPTQTFFNLAAEKKDRIINAAIKEFATRDLIESNISNIVKNSGISRGSFYQYFSSKDDLYKYIYSALRDVRQQYLNDVFLVFKKVPFVEFFKRFYLKTAEFLLRNPSHIKLGTHLYTCSSELSRELITQQQNRYKDTFYIGIEHDKQLNIIGQHVDSNALADLFVHICTDIFIFENMISQINIENLEIEITKLLFIINNGIIPKEH